MRSAPGRNGRPPDPTDGRHRAASARVVRLERGRQARGPNGSVPGIIEGQPWSTSPAGAPQADLAWAFVGKQLGPAAGGLAQARREPATASVAASRPAPAAAASASRARERAGSPQPPRTASPSSTGANSEPSEAGAGSPERRKNRVANQPARRPIVSGARA